MPVDMHPLVRTVIGSTRLEGGPVDDDMIRDGEAIVAGALCGDDAVAAVLERRGYTVPAR